MLLIDSGDFRHKPFSLGYVRATTSVLRIELTSFSVKLRIDLGVSGKPSVIAFLTASLSFIS